MTIEDFKNCIDQREKTFNENKQLIYDLRTIIGDKYNSINFLNLIFNYTDKSQQAIKIQKNDIDTVVKIFINCLDQENYEIKEEFKSWGVE